MSRARFPGVRRRLSAILLDHRSGGWSTACVESLREEWCRTGRRGADLEILVVPRAAPAGSHGDVVRVIPGVSGEPAARAVARAFAETRGGPADVVGLLEPDLFFPPGSLGPLLDRIEDDPECAAVSPRAFVDEELVLQPPCPIAPTATDELARCLARLFPSDARELGRRRIEESLAWWTSRRAVRPAFLAPGCVLLRRDVIERLEPWIEEEDSGRLGLLAELSQRLRALGLDLVRESRSVVLHHGSARPRSPERTGAEHPRDDRAEYVARNEGRLARVAVGAARALLRRWPARWRDRPAHAVAELGALSRPVRVELPRVARCAIELSREPTFLDVLGVSTRGGPWRMPERTWRWLAPGSWWLRAVDVGSGLVVGAWSFEKEDGARSEAMTLEEWEACRREGREGTGIAA